MWSTPSSTARSRTRRHSSGSAGGPKTCGPLSCMAPKPMRSTSLKVFMLSTVHGWRRSWWSPARPPPDRVVMADPEGNELYVA